MGFMNLSFVEYMIRIQITGEVYSLEEDEVMLNTMRKNAGSWIIKILLLAIVIVFIFWGVGSFRNEQGGRVAEVNGFVISYDDWLRSYNIMIENLKQRFGENLNEDLIKMLNVKSEVLNQLINNRLLAEEARRLKFDISREELAEAIQQIQVFRTNGVFDNRQYQRVLEFYKTTPEQFEGSQEEAMLIGRLKNLIDNSVKVSDQEALEWYKWENASVNIEYVLFEPKNYKDINPSEDEIRRYFEEHKTSFETEPMVKVHYLFFNPEAYKEKTIIADQDVEDYYQGNEDEFFVPKTVEARHILFMLAPDEKPEIVEEKRKKAEEVMTMAKGGKDFGELAKTYSEEPGKANGGYLGNFKKEDMVQPFADKAFSMAAGDISEPVRTQFGWHVIKVEKVNPESRKTLNEVKNEIRKKLTDKAAKDMAYEAAEAVYDKSLEKGDLSQIAREMNLPLLTTDFFSKAGPEKGVASQTEFATAAFKLDEKEISEILELDGGYYMLQSLEKMPAKIPEFDSVKERVKKDVMSLKQEEAAKKDAEKLLARLKSKETANPEKGTGPVFKSTGFFARHQGIPGLGNEKAVSDKAFVLSKENALPEQALKGNNGYYVIRFKERKSPDIGGFDSEKQKIRERLLSQKQMKRFNALVMDLRKGSDISIKDGFL